MYKSYAVLFSCQNMGKGGPWKAPKFWMSNPGRVLTIDMLIEDPSGRPC